MANVIAFQEMKNGYEGDGIYPQSEEVLNGRSANGLLLIMIYPLNLRFTKREILDIIYSCILSPFLFHITVFFDLLEYITTYMHIHVCPLFYLIIGYILWSAAFFPHIQYFCEGS